MGVMGMNLVAAQPAIKEPDLSDQSDDDLITMIGWDSSDPLIARAAWGTFYVRYRKRVFWLCRGYHDPWNVVGEVFRRVKESAATFNVKPMQNEADPEKKQRIVLSWLGKIGRSIACDEYRRRGATACDPVILQETILDDCPATLEMLAEGNSELAERARHLVETLLSDAERDVVRVSMLWYNPDHTRCYLPPDVLAELCKRLGTTKDNIRRIRKTALGRIREELEADFDGSPSSK